MREGFLRAGIAADTTVAGGLVEVGGNLFGQIAVIVNDGDADIFFHLIFGELV
jgi:hypothetical protein